MEKVKCEKCGESGYTASPNYVICRCGGTFIKSENPPKRKKVVLDRKTFNLFNTRPAIVCKYEKLGVKKKQRYQI